MRRTRARNQEARPACSQGGDLLRPYLSDAKRGSSDCAARPPSLQLPSHLLSALLELVRDARGQVALERATALGMLAVERPVARALAVFIDPPEFLAQPSGDVCPDALGHVVLSVRVRNAESVQWVKNGIALKEGADGGRISGVTSNTLVISHLLGRDKNQKVWAIAKNKWGKVTSSQVTLKVPNGEDAGPKVQDDSSELSTRRQSFALSLSELTSSDRDASNSSKRRVQT